MDQLSGSEESSFHVLTNPFSRKVFGHGAAVAEHDEDVVSSFPTAFKTRLAFLLRNPENHPALLKLGYASLETFLQSNVTGPPLDFDPPTIIFPPHVCHHHDGPRLPALRKHMVTDLSLQGSAIYPLTPHVELFWVAKMILSDDGLCGGMDEDGRRARLRVNFWHQKLLPEANDALRDQIYRDAEVLDDRLRRLGPQSHLADFLVEKAVVNIYYGDDGQARKGLAAAAEMRPFEFALTGVLGKRTRFQQDDISQLVVLASSGEATANFGSGVERPSKTTINGHDKSIPLDEARAQGKSPTIRSPATTTEQSGPENIPLKDDTLLESIQFNPPKSLPEIVSERTALAPALAKLDPSSQPQLHPLDSIILLQIASSITNTTPSDGLTREETMPYASRVLEAGSSNWQVYTQALLVRSRIEGYRSRTAERGLLQLQALVDQVTVDTTRRKLSNAESSLPLPSSSSDYPSPAPSSEATTFLPAARRSESASVADRLKYIYQLHPPLRWELEAELAARWVSMGGLRTALEIYDRLEMHAEVALCLAATDNEAKAIQIVRMLLFKPATTDAGAGEAEQGREEESEEVLETTKQGKERDDLPIDAPRLFCILGDLENEPRHYERAWTVSRGRYARAQRSLGRHHVQRGRGGKIRDSYVAAAEAYGKSLAVKRLDAATWFALGCVQLELERFGGAVQSFTHAVQIEAEDAEAWSNLAAALMHVPDEEGEDEERHTGEGELDEGSLEENRPNSTAEGDVQTRNDDDDNDNSNKKQTNKKRGSPNRNKEHALHALRQATRVKQSDRRVWDNYLTVAASLIPSHPTGTTTAPWHEILHAQSHLLDLTTASHAHLGHQSQGQEIGNARGIGAAESAISELILRQVVRHVTTNYQASASISTSTSTPSNPSSHSLPQSLYKLLTTKIRPLITRTPTLWVLIAELERWRGDADAEMEAWECGWRCAVAVVSGMEFAGIVEGGGGKKENKEKKRGKGKDREREKENKKEMEEEGNKAWKTLLQITICLVNVYLDRRRTMMAVDTAVTSSDNRHHQTQNQSGSQKEQEQRNHTPSSPASSEPTSGPAPAPTPNSLRFKAQNALGKVMALYPDRNPDLSPNSSPSPRSRYSTGKDEDGEIGEVWVDVRGMDEDVNLDISRGWETLQELRRMVDDS